MIITLSRNRSGTTLVEMMVAVVMTALIASAVAGLLASQLRLTHSVAERAVAREAVRTASAVLSAETRRMTRADIASSGSDSITVRAFRGIAIPCAAAPTRIVVRYVGDRAPDPVKDSVLVVSYDGEVAVRLLDSTAASSTCGAAPGEVVLEWTLAQPPGGAAALLLFETGTYHLAQSALRYRIGAAGRQPLTPEVLRHPGTGFTGIDSTAVRFSLDAGLIRVSRAAPFPPAPVP
jgi:hypothetical protein